MSSLSRLDIKREITKLNRLDPKSAAYSAIQSTYSRILGGLHVVVGRAGGGELFYRVRKTGGVKPSMVGELQAPPVKFVTGYQRCNPPGVPMFYAASQRLGALVESRVEVGEIVYLSQWIGREQIPLNRIFDSEENQIVLGADQSTVSGPNDDLLLAYLDTQFTKRIHSTFADDYKFTAAIAQQLTTGFPAGVSDGVREDGYVALKYPSVHGLETFHNTAMQASFAAERLDLLHVMELEILSVMGTDVSVRIRDTATNFESERIEWSSNPNSVPTLLRGKKNVPFVSNGKKWRLQLYGGPVTQEYTNLLMRN